MSERMVNKAINLVKKIVTISCFIGVIVTTILFTTVVEKLKRSTLVFVNNNNELTLLEVVSKGHLRGCDDNPAFKCKNLVWNNTNFRGADLMEGVGYVGTEINTIDMANNDTHFYDLAFIYHWDVHAPPELKISNPHCKKCATNSILCQQLLDKIYHLQKCEGKL